MNTLIHRRWDYPDLPRSLVRYVAVVSIAGPTLAILAGFSLPHSAADQNWVLIAVLTVMAGLAERFPIHLTHKTHLNIATAVYVAMFLSLPPGLCCILILIASLAAQLGRVRFDSSMGLSEPLFNVGQTALYTTVAALSVALLEGTAFGLPSWTGSALVVGVVASIIMHLGNTLLVAGAASRHMDLPFKRVWRQNLTLDLVPHVAMTLVGFAAAEIGATAPLLVPVLAIPAVLVHRAVRESVLLREDTREALAALVEIVELRDPYTAGHSRRVSVTARLLALELGLSAEEADEIATAGEVHDIGKVAIDPAIVAKPGKLTEDEWIEMRLHPVHGANVIGRFSTYSKGVPMVRSHHESMDGTGYPDQLAGPKIPLGARILAVADTFDALTSDRPYRSGMPLAKAIAILEDGRGVQWDSDVVGALFRLIDQNPCLVPIYKAKEPADELNRSDAA